MILMTMHFADAFSPFSGEAILGTQRYVSMRFAIKYFSFSGEAILGTQRYVAHNDHLRKSFAQIICANHFTQ